MHNFVAHVLTIITDDPVLPSSLDLHAVTAVALEVNQFAGTVVFTYWMGDDTAAGRHEVESTARCMSQLRNGPLRTWMGSIKNKPMFRLTWDAATFTIAHPPAFDVLQKLNGFIERSFVLPLSEFDDLELTDLVLDRAPNRRNVVYCRYHRKTSQRDNQLTAAEFLSSALIPTEDTEAWEQLQALIELVYPDSLEDNRRVHGWPGSYLLTKHNIICRREKEKDTK